MSPPRVGPSGSRRKCQYKGCKNVKKYCPDKRFFCFPNPDKFPDLFKQWIINTENIGILDSVSKNLLHKTVCADHFKDSSFRDARKIKLWPNAVPEPRECTSSDSSGVDEPATPSKPGPSTSASSGPAAAVVLDSPAGNRWNPSISTTTRQQDVMDSPSGNKWKSKISTSSGPAMQKDSPSGNKWRVGRPTTAATEPGKPTTLTVTRASPKLKSKAPVYSRAVQVGKSQVRNVKVKNHMIATKRAIISRLKKRQINQLTSNSFLNMIERHVKKCKFTDSERNMVLSLFYKSPSAYSFLRKQLLLKSLPARQTIVKWLSHLRVQPGWNSDLFKLLGNRVKCMPESEKDVVLIFDEINLKKGLEYDSRTDSVIGFQNHGDVSVPKLANHALLFMIRGLKTKWKLPIAHFFSCGVTTSEALSHIVRQTIRELIKIGLRVRAVVCDQGSTNRRAMGLLGVTRSKPHFKVDDSKIYIIYDVPHLIKSIRNNMMRAKGIKFDGGVAQWIHITKLYEADQRKEGNIVKARINTRLTQKHLNPVGREKMNVRLATQVFSHTVEAGLLTAAQMPEFGPAAEETAMFVGKINDCFDVLNSKTLKGRSRLHSALSVKNKVATDFLREMVPWCDKLKVITPKDKLKTVPCFWGLKMSLTNVLKLWNDLKKEKTSFLLTARLNQDPVENEFSMIRQRGGWNVEPTPAQFSRALRWRLATSLLRPAESANCEPDDDEVIQLVPPPPPPPPPPSSTVQTTSTLTDPDPTTSTADMDTLDSCDESDDVFSEDEHMDMDIDDPQDLSEPLLMDEGVVDDMTVPGLDQDEADSLLRANAVTYFSGVISFYTLKKFKCRSCEEHMCKGTNVLERNDELLTHFKAYHTTKVVSDFGKLRVPSEQFRAVVDICVTAFERSISNIICKSGVKETMFKVCVSELNKVYPNWINAECCEHRKFSIDRLIAIKLNYELKIRISSLPKTQRRVSNKEKDSANLQKIVRKKLFH